jgi:hypothetical protein
MQMVPNYFEVAVLAALFPLTHLMNFSINLKVNSGVLLPVRPAAVFRTGHL